MTERNGIAYLSFTKRGAALAERLRKALGGETASAHSASGVTLSAWTAENFPVRRALVYVGAAGIAVRAIAPYLRDKSTDPAVIAVDERGLFAVPLASGHLGGANDLARQIASLTGGTAVVTTATDINGVFAVDAWARRQGCAVVHVSEIKRVSAKLLAGGTVRLFAAFPIAGNPPDGVEIAENPPSAALRRHPPQKGGDKSGAEASATMPGSADIWLDVRRHPPLSLAPKALVLGVGCRRGISKETLERRFSALCEDCGLWPQAFSAAATIDLKANESGLLDFCAAHGWDLRCFSADELRQTQGTFTASAFVERRTGVDNVCERAAVTLSQGDLLVRKYAGEGVTFAVARRRMQFDWSC